MMFIRLLLSLIVAAATLALSPGCSSSKLTPPKTVPVSGSVTYKGRPASGVRVRFHPQFDIGKVKFIPYGETGPDGKFLVNTGAPGNGAPPGDYIVSMEMPRIEPDPRDGLESEVDQWKGAYSDPAKSDWKVTIQEGENLLEPFRVN